MVDRSVEVGNDVMKMVMFLTNYVVGFVLKQDGLYVKVGNTANKQAVTVNVTAHRDLNNNWLQDKLLAVRLTLRLLLALNKVNKGDQ